MFGNRFSFVYDYCSPNKLPNIRGSYLAFKIRLLVRSAGARCPLNPFIESLHWILRRGAHWIPSLDPFIESCHWLLSLNPVSGSYRWALSLNPTIESFPWVHSLNPIIESYHSLNNVCVIETSIIHLKLGWAAGEIRNPWLEISPSDFTPHFDSYEVFSVVH